jgi:hypothetical protein
MDAAAKPIMEPAVFEKIVELIEDNKDKMTDADYMAMMDGMKKVFEAKTNQPNLPPPLINIIQHREQNAARLAAQRARAAERRAFLPPVAFRRPPTIRCSACGGEGHNRRNYACPARITLIEL